MASCPVLFINSFINLRGPEGVGHIARLEIDVLLVHLDAAVTPGLHRHVHGDSLPRPCGQRSVAEIVKLELPHVRRLRAFLICAWTSLLLIAVPSFKVSTSPCRLGTIAVLRCSVLICS